MRIGILSRGQASFSTKRLMEACRARGHSCEVLDTLSFSVIVEEGRSSLLYQNRPFVGYDAIIPRIGASITFYGTAVVRQLEHMGVFVLNTSHAITVARDKLRALQLMSRHQVPFPATVFVRGGDEVLTAVERVGGAPVIVKLVEGTQGVGVILAETSKVAQAIVETLQTVQKNVLIQKFVEESRGRDVRAFIVGGRVVAAMRRTALGDEYRSNVHRGARAEGIALSASYETVALRAAEIMGLEVAGVDMLEGHDGPQVMEVNSSPGLEGIEGASRVDVASAMIRHLETVVDEGAVGPALRERVVLAHGMAVGELSVGEKLEGKRIGEVVPDGVRVLSLIRRGGSNEAPERAMLIAAGDLLVIYGRPERLRALGVPTETPEIAPRSTTA
jgi:ribosomal protein S6--L-glutamate ligase